MRAENESIWGQITAAPRKGCLNDLFWYLAILWVIICLFRAHKRHNIDPFTVPRIITSFKTAAKLFQIRSELKLEIYKEVAAPRKRRKNWRCTSSSSSLKLHLLSPSFFGTMPLGGKKWLTVINTSSFRLSWKKDKNCCWTSTIKENRKMYQKNCPSFSQTLNLNKQQLLSKR